MPRPHCVVCRPVIQQVEDNAWQYGDVYNVSVGWTQVSAFVDRAVLSRCGGVTHSIHFDQRQVHLQADLPQDADITQAAAPFC